MQTIPWNWYISTLFLITATLMSAEELTTPHISTYSENVQLTDSDFFFDVSVNNFDKGIDTTYEFTITARSSNHKVHLYFFTPFALNAYVEVYDMTNNGTRQIDLSGIHMIDDLNQFVIAPPPSIVSTSQSLLIRVASYSPDPMTLQDFQALATDYENKDGCDDNWIYSINKQDNQLVLRPNNTLKNSCFQIVHITDIHNDPSVVMNVKFFADDISTHNTYKGLSFSNLISRNAAISSLFVYDKYVMVEALGSYLNNAYLVSWHITGDTQSVDARRFRNNRDTALLTTADLFPSRPPTSSVLRQRFDVAIADKTTLISLYFYRGIGQATVTIHYKTTEQDPTPTLLGTFIQSILPDMTQFNCTSFTVDYSCYNNGEVDNGLVLEFTKRSYDFYDIAWFTDDSFLHEVSVLNFAADVDSIYEFQILARNGKRVHLYFYTPIKDVILQVYDGYSMACDECLIDLNQIEVDLTQPYLNPPKVSSTNTTMLIRLRSRSGLAALLAFRALATDFEPNEACGNNWITSMNIQNTGISNLTIPGNQQCLQLIHANDLQNNPMVQITVNNIGTNPFKMFKGLNFENEVKNADTLLYPYVFNDNVIIRPMPNGTVNLSVNWTIADWIIYVNASGDGGRSRMLMSEAPDIGQPSSKVHQLFDVTTSLDSSESTVNLTILMKDNSHCSTEIEYYTASGIDGYVTCSSRDYHPTNICNKNQMSFNCTSFTVTYDCPAANSSDIFLAEYTVLRPAPQTTTSHTTGLGTNLVQLATIFIMMNIVY